MPKILYCLNILIWNEIINIIELSHSYCLKLINSKTLLISELFKEVEFFDLHCIIGHLSYLIIAPYYRYRKVFTVFCIHFHVLYVHLSNVDLCLCMYVHVICRYMCMFMYVYVQARVQGEGGKGPAPPRN